MTLDATTKQRQEKDEYFRTSPDSPLRKVQQEAFTGLHYFDYNPEYDLTIRLHLFAVREQISVFTTKNEIRPYRRLGELRFNVDNYKVRLTVFETPHGFFLPFVDAGAGTLTYSAGRYVIPEKQADGLFRVDFNQAYNPYCAYDDRWDCPITPEENHIEVTIEAGEMLPQGDWLTLT